MTRADLPAYQINADVDRWEDTKRSYTQIMEFAKKTGEETEALRMLARQDLFFLLVYLLNRSDADHPWIFARCREIQQQPDGYLDVYAREHYKSTIITFALSIQEILNNPEITVGIFSFTRPIAKAFLRQIKFELEMNKKLQHLFPEILWESDKEAQKNNVKWSEDDGITVKRKSNPKEATIEAWGLVDGQPTGRHFQLRVYDDVITNESVSTPDMIRKTTERWEMSTNLGTEGGRFRCIGTYYHLHDTYKEMIDRGAVIERKYAATDNGKADGNPVLKTREWLKERRTSQGPFIFSAQILCNPKEDGSIGFRKEWLRFWTPMYHDKMNKIIVVDPATEKKKDSDYTAAFVIGLGSDQNVYILDMYRDRLNLTERANLVFYLHRKYKPKSVGYEKYGMMSDIHYIKERQETEQYRFPIVELGGRQSKSDRIKSLVPYFENGRIYLPEECIRTQYDNRKFDLTQSFIRDEYEPFPFGAHDDMLDALARFSELNLSFPEEAQRDYGAFSVPRTETGYKQGVGYVDFDPLSYGL